VTPNIAAYLGNNRRGSDDDCRRGRIETLTGLFDVDRIVLDGVYLAEVDALPRRPSVRPRSQPRPSQ
jgi:hypothetical protein